MKHLLADYVRYNYWANNRMTNRLARVADSLLEKEIPSSFPSMERSKNKLPILK